MFTLSLKSYFISLFIYWTQLFKFIFKLLYVYYKLPFYVMSMLLNNQNLYYNAVFNNMFTYTLSNYLDNKYVLQSLSYLGNSNVIKINYLVLHIVYYLKFMYIKIFNSILFKWLTSFFIGGFLWLFIEYNFVKYSTFIKDCILYYLNVEPVTIYVKSEPVNIPLPLPEVPEVSKPKPFIIDEPIIIDEPNVYLTEGFNWDLIIFGVSVVILGVTGFLLYKEWTKLLEYQELSEAFRKAEIETANQLLTTYFDIPQSESVSMLTKFHEFIIEYQIEVYTQKLSSLLNTEITIISKEEMFRLMYTLRSSLNSPHVPKSAIAEQLPNYLDAFKSLETKLDSIDNKLNTDFNSIDVGSLETKLGWIQEDLNGNLDSIKSLDTTYSFSDINPKLNVPEFSDIITITIPKPKLTLNIPEFSNSFISPTPNTGSGFNTSFLGNSNFHTNYFPKTLIQDFHL